MSEHKYFDDGGPAFPVPEQNRLSDGTCCNEGMTLRDWFAGQALPEFIVINERVTAGRKNVSYETALKVTAEQAYAIADAMIAARKGGA